MKMPYWLKQKEKINSFTLLKSLVLALNINILQVSRSKQILLFSSTFSVFLDLALSLSHSLVHPWVCTYTLTTCF